MRGETHAGRVFRVRVAGDNARAIELLRTRPEIQDVSEEEGRIKVVLDESLADAGLVAETLVRGGARLVELREDELGLEEVFLRVTKGETQ